MGRSPLLLLHVSLHIEGRQAARASECVVVPSRLLLHIKSSGAAELIGTVAVASFCMVHHYISRAGRRRHGRVRRRRLDYSCSSFSLLVKGVKGSAAFHKDSDFAKSSGSALLGSFRYYYVSKAVGPWAGAPTSSLTSYEKENSHII